MARIRQQHPQNYTSTGNINTEFESILRYLNSAELGGKSVSELMSTIFNEEGDFSGAIEMRLDTAAGLQYRTGTFSDTEDGWTSIAEISDLRGRAGQDFGTIEAPLFYNRYETTTADGDSVVTYEFDENTDDIVVYVNGILQAADTYTASSAANTVTFNAPLAGSNTVTIYSIRSSTVTGFRRADITAVQGQAVVPFVHTADERLLVHRNGILQREGATYDYVASSGTDTLTFLTTLMNGDVISVMTIENTSAVVVGGLMAEDEFTDENGYIPYAKLAVPDSAIPVGKVATLVDELADKAHLIISGTTPTNADDGWLWLDISGATPELKFFESDVWYTTNPDATLPVPESTDALRYLRVNSSGSGFEIADLNLSSVILKSAKGAANGVPTLDSQGLIPSTQLPVIRSVGTYSTVLDGAVADGTYPIVRLWKQTSMIDGISVKTGAGSCSVQISVDGTTYGSVYTANTTGSDVTLSTSMEVNAESNGRSVEIAVTSATTDLADLQIAISTATETAA